MKLTGMSLHSSETSEPISFSLRDADPRAPYVIRAVSGLDAEEIVPKFYGTSKVSSSRLYDFSLKSREIIMRINLRPRFNINESYSDLRSEIYKLISATRTGMVMLRYHSGENIVAYSLGFIIKVEAAQFEQTPEIQVTFYCADPMIRGFVPVILLTDDIATENVIGVVDALSDAPHGFSFKITFNDTISTFTLQDKDSNPEWTFKVVPSTDFLEGDELYFSSEYSNKYLFVVRDEDVTHLMDKIEPTSVWPSIYPGTNVIYIAEISDGLPYFVWDNIQFAPAYWGV